MQKIKSADALVNLSFPPSLLFPETNEKFQRKISIKFLINLFFTMCHTYISGYTVYVLKNGECS